MGKNRKNSSRRYQHHHNDRTTLTPENLAALKASIEAKRQLLCRSASFHSKTVVPMLRAHGFDVVELTRSEQEETGVDELTGKFNDTLHIGNSNAIENGDRKAKSIAESERFKGSNQTELRQPRLHGESDTISNNATSIIPTQSDLQSLPSENPDQMSRNSLTNEYSFSTAPQAKSQPHSARGLNVQVSTVVKIRCLGLGSPSSTIETQPKFQLAYLLHLVACLRVKPANVSLYDPVFNELDMALLVNEFGFRVDLQDPFVGEIDDVSTESQESQESQENQESQESQNDTTNTNLDGDCTYGTTIAPSVPISSATASSSSSTTTTKILYYLPHIPLNLMENVIQKSQPFYMIGNDVVEHVAKLRLAEVWAKYPQVARMSVVLEEKLRKQKELEKQRQHGPQDKDVEKEKESWLLKGEDKLGAHGEKRAVVGEEEDDENKNTNKHRYTSTSLHNGKSHHHPGDNGVIGDVGTNNNSNNEFQQVKPRGNRRQKSQAAKLRAAGANEQALRAEILGSVKMAVKSDNRSGDTASCGSENEKMDEYLRRWSVAGEWVRVNSDNSNSIGGSSSSSSSSSDDDGWGSSFSDLAVLCA